jgi:hypothetical protein
MYAETSDRPGLDEQYIAATNASDLTLDPDRRGAADHLIAAGLAANRMGQALKHLLSEWAVAPKPAPWTEDDVLALATQLPKRKDKLDVKRARAMVISEYAAALRRAYMRLPGRMDALAIMAEWAARRGVDPDLLSPALYHRLAPNCPACHGRKQEKRPDAPVLGKQCTHCAGTGTWPRPPGAERVDNWLRGCSGREKGDRARVMHEELTPEEWRELRESRMRGDVEPEDTADEAARIAALFRIGNRGLRRNG